LLWSRQLRGRPGPGDSSGDDRRTGGEGHRRGRRLRADDGLRRGGVLHQNLRRLAGIGHDHLLLEGILDDDLLGQARGVLNDHLLLDARAVLDHHLLLDSGAVLNDHLLLDARAVLDHHLLLDSGAVLNDQRLRLPGRVLDDHGGRLRLLLDHAAGLALDDHGGRLRLLLDHAAGLALDDDGLAGRRGQHLGLGLQDDDGLAAAGRRGRVQHLSVSIDLERFGVILTLESQAPGAKPLHLQHWR
jgi:hypothetical protein